MEDQSEADDTGLVDTVREATTHITRSLALLDRLLRPAPPVGEVGPVSVQDSLQFVAALFRTHRSAVTLELDTESAGSLPAVRGEEHELEQILLTLVLLTLDALDERVSVITLRAVPDGDRVTITTTTSEPGRAPEDGPPRGAMGLDAARVLAARHGGSLARVGEACGFTLHLPCWPGRPS